MCANVEWNPTAGNLPSLPVRCFLYKHHTQPRASLYNTDNGAALLKHQCKPKLNTPEGGLVTLLHTLTSKQTPAMTHAQSWQPFGLKCTFKFPPICSERVMYVDTITHARVHVWLCDNAGPAWQAPRIIALGRELHNNVGLGNACGLGLSAVSGPVNVALLAPCVSAATLT